MNKGSGQADTGEAAPLSRAQQGATVMARQRNIHRQRLVLRKRRAADGPIPLPAAVAGIDDQRAPHIAAQRLQRIEEIGRVPVFPAAEPPTAPACQLAH